MTAAKTLEILVVEDQKIVQQSFTDARAELLASGRECPELVFAEGMRAAYWSFVSEPSRWRAVILDFQLRPDQKSYDGIDLALAFAQRCREIDEPPWIIGYSGSSGDVPKGAEGPLEAFLRLQRTYPKSIRGLVLKDLNVFVDGIGPPPYELLRVIAEGDLAALDRWREVILKRVRGRPTGIDDEPPRERGSDDEVAAIHRALFPTYYSFQPSNFQRGYDSRCRVQYVKARLLEGAEEKWFALKITDQPSKAKAEVANFRAFAPSIQANAPICFGNADFVHSNATQQVVAYELVGLNPVLGGVASFSSRIEGQIELLSPTEQNASIVYDEYDGTFAEASSVFSALHGWWHRTDAMPAVPASGEWPARLKSTFEKVRKSVHGMWGDAGNPDSNGRFAGRLLHKCLERGDFAHPLGVAEEVLKLRINGAAPERARVAHGDLHGENVLDAGIGDDGRRHWMIIDFEDVRNDAPLAYDVASLECDLKWRCLDGIDKLDRFRLELLLAASSSDMIGRRQASDLLACPDLDGRPSAHVELLRERLINIRRAAHAHLWGAGDPGAPITDNTRRFQLHVALLLRSLELLSYLDEDVDGRMHCWFTAVLSAGVVRRHVQATYYGRAGR